MNFQNKTKMNIKLSIGVVLAIFFIACNSNEIEKKQAELKKVKEEITSLHKVAKELEKELAELDTTLKVELGTIVEVKQLEKDTFYHTVKVHGKVEASKNIFASPEVGGKITAIYVKEGDKVGKGQTIAAIDASILLNNIAEVKKGLEFANTMFEKQKSLNDKGIGTEVQFLEVKNRKETLEISLATLNSQLEKYIIKAPIDGYIEDILPKIGEMASPQMAIAHIVNIEKVVVESEVSEALIGKIKLQDEVTVFFPNLNKTIQGKVIQIGQFINPQNRTFKIQVDLNQQSSLFKPNLLAVIELNDYTNNNAIFVPNKTIQVDLQGNFVYVIENKAAVKKYVTLGESTNLETEILNGLSEKELVIVKGQQGLVQGENVRFDTL